MKMILEKGRPRLRTLLSLVGGGACTISMALVVLLYKTPYNPNWWFIMALILAGSILLPRLFVGPIEWVIKGYTEDE